LILTDAEYKTMREDYYYHDRNCRFDILATEALDSKCVGKYEGIFPKRVPPHYPRGINLRRFETIVQAVFAAASHAESNKTITATHVMNLKEIICAVVHWKMASQGGRADLKVDNVKKKWANGSEEQVIDAYRRKDLALFEIGGIRIPTATAFLRFLFPNDCGIMDSRVVKITQREGITRLDIREDGWIKDKAQNREQYIKNYNPFLVEEARQLNNRGVLFQDIDEHGNSVNSRFRPCDIEMALF